jgi:hypothetical protein
MIDTNGKTIFERLDVFIFTPPPLAIWFLMASATLLTSFTHFVLLQICKIEWFSPSRPTKLAPPQSNQEREEFARRVLGDLKA